MSDLSGKWQREAATTASTVNSAAAARAELCNRPDWPISTSARVAHGPDRPGWYYRLAAELWRDGGHSESVARWEASRRQAKASGKAAAERRTYDAVFADGRTARVTFFLRRRDKPGSREAVARAHLQLVHQGTVAAGWIEDAQGNRVADKAVGAHGKASKGIVRQCAPDCRPALAILPRIQEMPPAVPQTGHRRVVAPAGSLQAARGWRGMVLR